MTDNNFKLPPVAEQFIITERETQTPLTFQDVNYLENKNQEQAKEIRELKAKLHETEQKRQELARELREAEQKYPALKYWDCYNCGEGYNEKERQSCLRCGWVKKYAIDPNNFKEIPYRLRKEPWNK